MEAGWLAGYLAGWLAGYLAGWLAGYWAVWLAGLLDMTYTSILAIGIIFLGISML